MLDIRADLTGLKPDASPKAACPECGQGYADDECYDISEDSPWEIEAFLGRLREILTSFEKGESGLYGGRDMGVVPAMLTIRVKRCEQPRLAPKPIEPELRREPRYMGGCTDIMGVRGNED